MLEKNIQERWWEEHGGEEWKNEMERRGNTEHYENQIKLLDNVISPFCLGEGDHTVLEVGCGYGRIISYIRDTFEEFEVFGADQSSTMLKEAEKFGFKGENLYHENARGFSNGLPKFNIVYTCEMLIHVPPDEIRGVVKNILGRALRYVIHIENWPIPKGLKSCKSSNEHAGCFMHNFEEIYAELGKLVKIVSRDGTQHSAYIIKV